jgi:hypothetical protein
LLKEIRLEANKTNPKDIPEEGIKENDERVEFH